MQVYMLAPIEDFEGIGPVDLLRDEAIETAGPILARYGELLPIDCDGADVVTFNAGQVLDVLDEERSDIDRFADGRIMGIDTPTPSAARYRNAPRSRFRRSRTARSSTPRPWSRS